MRTDQSNKSGVNANKADKDVAVGAINLGATGMSGG